MKNYSVFVFENDLRLKKYKDKKQTKPKPKIKLGHHPEIFKFTGKFSKQTLGYYKASRNKKIMYAPIYKDNDGIILIDMTQLFEPKEMEQ